jgi:hypothetical protein
VDVEVDGILVWSIAGSETATSPSTLFPGLVWCPGVYWTWSFLASFFLDFYAIADLSEIVVCRRPKFQPDRSLRRRAEAFEGNNTVTFNCLPWLSKGCGD